MKLTSLEFYVDSIHLIGLICIAICAATWAVDLLGMVYPCPYCRVERSVIGVLGLFMLFRNHHNWIMLYVASVIGFMGANTAAAQNFLRWIKISGGEFKISDPFYFDNFLLSGAALFIIIGQLWLMALSAKKLAKQSSQDDADVLETEP